MSAVAPTATSPMIAMAAHRLPSYREASWKAGMKVDGSKPMEPGGLGGAS